MWIELTAHARQRYAERYGSALNLGAFKDSLSIAYLSKREEDCLLIGEQFLFFCDNLAAVVELTDHCLLVVTFLPPSNESVLSRLKAWSRVWKVLVLMPSQTFLFISDAQYSTGWPKF